MEISKLVPGLVSTEVDARASFNTQETIKKAKKLIAMYEDYSRKKKIYLFAQPLYHYQVNESDTRRNHNTPQTRFLK